MMRALWRVLLIFCWFLVSVRIGILAGRHFSICCLAWSARSFAVCERMRTVLYDCYVSIVRVRALGILRLAYISSMTLGLLNGFMASWY